MCTGIRRLKMGAAAGQADAKEIHALGNRELEAAADQFQFRTVALSPQRFQRGLTIWAMIFPFHARLFPEFPLPPDPWRGRRRSCLIQPQA